MGGHLVVGLRGVREGRACDGEEEEEVDGRLEEHAAAEHLVGGEICAVRGGCGGASQSRTSTSCLIRRR